VLLVVEVADSTVVTDRKVKIPLYAKAGIPEVWLVNIPKERIEIYSDPEGESYGQIKRFGRGRRARSQTLEGLAVGVDEVPGQSSGDEALHALKKRRPECFTSFGT
jgi:Uma2 family endonuclease